jgi:hypothetical protein
MAIIILENGWVSDSFTIGESPSFTDAIVMPADDYNALTADEIAAMNAKTAASRASRLARDLPDSPFNAKQQSLISLKCCLAQKFLLLM